MNIYAVQGRDMKTLTISAKTSLEAARIYRDTFADIEISLIGTLLMSIEGAGETSGCFRGIRPRFYNGVTLHAEDPPE